MTMRTLTRAVVVVSIAALAATASAALSPKFVECGKGPAQYLMTKDEQAQWKAVKTDDDAKKFIDAFWARRGPNSKADFEAKVKYADEHFAEPHKKGSMTDRGHVLIVLGGPAKRQQSAPQMNTPPRIEPASRMCRTSARVSTPRIAGTPQSVSQDSQPPSASGASS